MQSFYNVIQFNSRYMQAPESIRNTNITQRLLIARNLQDMLMGFLYKNEKHMREFVQAAIIQEIIISLSYLSCKIPIGFCTLLFKCYLRVQSNDSALHISRIYISELVYCLFWNVTPFNLIIEEYELSFGIG